MIQVAIVGCGSIAHAHMEGLLTFPKRCQVVALCDIYPEKAEAMKKEYGLNCRIYADHETMLEKENKLDLVHVYATICTCRNFNSCVGCRMQCSSRKANGNLFI